MKFKKVLCLAAVTAMALSVQGGILAASSGSYGTINGSLSNGKISESTATDTIPVVKLISNEVTGGKRSIKFGWNRVAGYTYEYQLAGKPDFSDVFRSGTTRTTDNISWSPNTSVNSKDKKYANANIFARVRIVYNSSKNQLGVILLDLLQKVLRRSGVPQIQQLRFSNSLRTRKVVLQEL